MSWQAWLPLALQLVSWILGRVNASNETIQKFQDFVQATKDEGLISVEAADKFKAIHDKLIQDFKDAQKP